MLFNVLILFAFPFRFITQVSEDVKGYDVETSLVILAIPLIWWHCLFFFGFVESLGPFVVMIIKMLRGDISMFANVYVVILLGFSLGFLNIYKNIYEEETNTMTNMITAFFLCFQMSLGEFKVHFSHFN